MQVTPSPEYPVLQAQVKDPMVLVQVASALQSSVPSLHSSTSNNLIRVAKNKNKNKGGDAVFEIALKKKKTQ